MMAFLTFAQAMLFFCIVWEACLKSPFAAKPFWSGQLLPCREGPEYPFRKPEALFPFMMEEFL